MFWPPFIFNLCVGLLLAAYLLRAVRRFERRADAIMAKLDQWEAEELRKYDIARDEIRASMRAQVDAAVADMEAKFGDQPTGKVIEVLVANTLKLTHAAEARLTGVPTEDEIRKLPRWARVAFAARCARRVLPLVKHFWKGAPEHHLKAVDEAVRVAEHAADTAAVAADTAFVGAAASVAYAAAHAAHAAHAAVGNTHAAHAARAVAAADLATGAHVAFRSDFEIICSLALANNWTDDTAVSPSGFGPLWPDGPPERWPNWPKPEQPATELVFALEVPDNMTTAAAVELAKELSAMLCELDIAGSGHGLAVPNPEQNPVTFTGPVRVPVK